MNFLKVFYNSFFRSLGRIIVYILLGFLLSVVLSKIDVRADMTTPQEITFDNTTFGTYYEIPVVYTSRVLRIRIVDRLRNFSPIGTENTNLILDICASGKLKIWRTSAAGSSCSTSCFSQLIQIKEIPNLACRTYTYNDNKAYRIVLPINLWDMTGVTSAELDNITFDDKVTLSNNTEHDIYASIYGAYYSSIGFDINNQDALFNDLNQTQQNILNKQNEIINSQNNNTNNIINNQNENTDKEIDSQKVCHYYDKNSIILDKQYLNSSGVTASSTNFGVSDFISITSSSEIILTKKLTENFQSNVCFYNINKTFISCLPQANLTENQKLIVPNNASFVRFTINKVLNEPQWSICQNGNQAISGGLNDINSSINNDNVDDPSSSINSFKDKIANNGVITQLIGLPVTLFTKVLNNVNGTCSNYNLGSLFGTDLILPCVNIQNYLGSSLWSIIDVLISGLFVYSISRKFIKVFESMSSMNEGDVISD